MSFDFFESSLRASTALSLRAKRSNLIKRFAICFLSILILSSCGAKSLPVKKLKITKADGEVVEVKAEIAKRPEERNRGFMFRKKIPDGSGMLFIFESDQILRFWMKNTPHPLSIAYIDYKGEIRDIFDMTPFSEAEITSTVSVRYALEVPQGWYEKVGIKTGDFLDLEF